MRAEDVTDRLDMALTALGAIMPMFVTNQACSAKMTPATSRGAGGLNRGPTDEPRREPHASTDPVQDRAQASDPENRILLENYFQPGDLEAQIGAFVED